MIDSAYYSTMFMRTELLPSILISELQAVGTSRMVLLQELLLYIAEIFNRQDSTFYLEKYFSARCFILLGEILLCKMLHSTWRITHSTTGVFPIDSTILHGELHLYRSFPSKEPWSLQSILQGLPTVLTQPTRTFFLRNPQEHSTRRNWDKNSTKGNTSNGTIQVLMYIELQTFFNSPAELQSSRLQLQRKGDVALSACNCNDCSRLTPACQ